MLDQLKRLYERINIHWKFYVVTILFAVFFFFGGENTPALYVKNKLRINELNKSIEKLDRSTEELQNSIDKLNSDDQALEKFAREKYLMKNTDEQVFIVHEDSLP